jgi:hypothetical protein
LGATKTAAVTHPVALADGGRVAPRISSSFSSLLWEGTPETVRRSLNVRKKRKKEEKEKKKKRGKQKEFRTKEKKHGTRPHGT